jgi:thioredoxin-related protein
MYRFLVEPKILKGESMKKILLITALVFVVTPFAMCGGKACKVSAPAVTIDDTFLNYAKSYDSLKDKMTLADFTKDMDKIVYKMKQMPYCPKMKKDVKTLKKSVKSYLKRTFKSKAREAYEEQRLKLGKALREMKACKKK